MRILFSSIALPVFGVIKLSFCQSHEHLFVYIFNSLVAGKIQQSLPAALFSCCSDLSGPVWRWQSQNTKVVSGFAFKEAAPKYCLDLQRTLSQKNRHFFGLSLPETYSRSQVIALPTNLQQLSITCRIQNHNTLLVIEDYVLPLAFFFFFQRFYLFI